MSKKTTSSSKKKASRSNPTNSNSGGSGKNQKSNLCCFGYVDYIVLASTLAVALGEELSITDLNILSTFLAVLSDELALVASIESCNSNDSDEVFVPPVPDVAVTRSDKNIAVPKKNKTRIKKIIKKKVKKK